MGSCAALCAKDGQFDPSCPHYGRPPVEHNVLSLLVNAETVTFVTAFTICSVCFCLVALVLLIISPPMKGERSDQDIAQVEQLAKAIVFYLSTPGLLNRCHYDDDVK